jgi:hypothetical protein
VSGTTVLNQILKQAWFDTQMGPRLIKALAMGRINGAPVGSIAAVLGSTPQYSRLKYMPLRLREWRI